MDNKDILISEAFEFYRHAEVIGNGCANGTVELYKVAEKHVLDFFGEDKPIRDVTLEETWSFLEYLKSFQRPDTACGYLTKFRAVLLYCYRFGIAKFDPYLVRIPKREKRTIYYLDERELEELVDDIGARRVGCSEERRLRNVAIAKVLISSGIRVGELCKLNRNSIKNRQFTIVGKSAHPRICWITSDTEEAIERYLETRTDDNPALFISYQGECGRLTPRAVRIIFRHAGLRTGFDKVHPHTLRHSFATLMLERDVDIRYIGEFLGHENLNTTKKYVHCSNQRLRRVYDRAMREQGWQNIDIRQTRKLWRDRKPCKSVDSV